MKTNTNLGRRASDKKKAEKKAAKASEGELLVIHHGHCLDVLRTIPDNTFHVCVTSPPYWSLRDYGVPPTVWGGDPSCSHEWASAGIELNKDYIALRQPAPPAELTEAS